MSDFTGNKIKDTFQRVLQVDGGNIQNGTGNLVDATINSLTASNGFQGNVDGTSSFALTSSYSISSSQAISASYVQNAQTSSYYAETDPIFVAKSGSLATTGSNTFVGTQTIQGLTRITGTSTIDLVRITQTGTGNAFVVEDSTNPDATPFVISSSGNVGIGTTTPNATLDVSGSAIITGSLTVTQGITGSLFGTASYATQALSASYSPPSVSVSASYATTASYASYAQTASIATTALNTSDVVIYVKNVTGASIAKGKVVRITGATGDNALISTASWDSDGVSANTLGILNETIANDAFGYAITEGKLLGINTQTFTAGQLLYLGPTGSLIGSEPIPPKHAVRLGQVLRSQLNNGSMYVRIDNGYELNELHNVLIISGSDGDLLVASGSNDNGEKLYINSKQLTGSYAITGSLNATSFTGSALLITGSTTTDLVRITQTGTGNVFVVEDSTNPDTTPFVITNTGLVGIGTTTPSASLDVNGNVQSGFATTASGSYSHAEGVNTISSGQYSHAEGENTLASGDGSHAEGLDTISIGNYSHAEGRETIAFGTNSHAEGRGTIASGSYSHAEGRGTIALGFYSHVQGQYNISSSDQSAFIVGNGTSDLNRSNLIFASGSTVQITGSLGVTGGVTASLQGTASYATTALTASNALTSSYVNTLTQNVIITGSLNVSGSVTATSYVGNGINNGKLLAITELTAPTLATFTVPSSTVFAAINCNSDATNRYAKITFTAPSSSIVEIIFEADIIFNNSAAVQMIGLNTTSTSTTTPNAGWFRINGDADASSASYRATFIINSLTPGTSYTYYVMSVCNFSNNLVRCGSLQTGAYVAGADRPSPLRVYARDIGTTVITTNPSS